MRKSRYQKGSVKKQRGRYVGMWWQDGGRKSLTLGLVKNMTKSEARAKVDQIVAALQEKQQGDREWLFGDFVRETYIPFYSRRWKPSTQGTTVNRVLVHLVREMGGRELKIIKRDDLQALLDSKAADGLSRAMVDHLRWDIRHIFEMAVDEGWIVRNPAKLLCTPRDAVQAEKRVMTALDVQSSFDVLDLRERLIVKLAILAGMRPGEIFSLRWQTLHATYADIRQRVYRGILDTPKTDRSVRKAALPEGLLQDIELWRSMAVTTDDRAWVFPSENMTPLWRENVWRRHMLPKLAAVGLEWVSFQVMRRSHGTLSNAFGVHGKLVADQCGHSLDVSQNVYTQSSVETRLAGVNLLEASLKKAS